MQFSCLRVEHVILSTRTAFQNKLSQLHLSLLVSRTTEHYVGCTLQHLCPFEVLPHERVLAKGITKWLILTMA
jgi:hypothetical protein